LIIDWTTAKRGLWANVQDALRHGADHFRSYTDSGNKSSHDIKWGVLSTHQAAECFSNILLIEVTPAEKKLTKNGSPWFPSLSTSTKLLLDGRGKNALSGGETRLLHLYQSLSDIRNQLTHRELPSKLDASDAAIAFLGTLKMAQRRMGPCLDEYRLDSPPIESSIHQAISYKRNQEYIDLASQLLADQNGTGDLGYCGLCGEHSVDTYTCAICFSEFESAICPDCDEINYYESWMPPGEIECICGREFST